MKKRIIPISLIALCILSSCSQTPDSIQGNNHNVDLNSENNKVSVEHILDDFDEAFETKYTKFKLPDKSSVIINQPEEVCDLELKYVNADKDTKWLKQKTSQLAEIFDIKNGVMKMTQDFRCSIESDKERISINQFSEPYFCSMYALNHIDLDLMNIKKIENLYRINTDKLNKKYQAVIDKSVKLSEQIYSLIGGDIISNPMDLFIMDYNDETYYEISMQPTFKNVGIQCISPIYSNRDIFEGNNALMTMSLNVKFLYDSKLNLHLFISCNGYTPVKSEPIDKMISFKGACDILEEELASNVSMEFDDVKLWYEPRGTILDATREDGFDGTKTTKCTPKWYFVSDSEEDKEVYYSFNYVTVDCVTGEIEVFFPG